MTERPRTPFDDRWDEIVSGWMLVDDHDELTDRIEALAKLMNEAGMHLADLSELQAATVKMMVEVQVARSVRDGWFEPYIFAELKVEAPNGEG
jgi:site-specific recombinase XerC